MTDTTQNPDDRDDDLETLAPSQFGEQGGDEQELAELGSEADGADPDPITEAPTTTD